MKISNDIRKLYKNSLGEGRATAKVLVRAAQELGFKCELVTYNQEFSRTGNEGRNTIQIKFDGRTYGHNIPIDHHTFRDFAEDIVDKLNEHQIKSLKIDYHIESLKELGVKVDLPQSLNGDF